MIDPKSLPWPTDSHRVTSPYGPRDGGFHNGIDIGLLDISELDDIIMSVCGGKAVKSYFSSSYGECVIIEHITDDGNKWCSLYAHQKEKWTELGQPVLAEQPIGIMGNTGHSTGTHLHFEIRLGQFNTRFFEKDDNGKFFNSVDPLLYLQGEEASRVYNDDLQYLVDQNIFKEQSMNYWQDLVDAQADMSKISVSTFLSAIKQTVEND